MHGEKASKLLKIVIYLCFNLFKRQVIGVGDFVGLDTILEVLTYTSLVYVAKHQAEVARQEALAWIGLAKVIVLKAATDFCEKVAKRFFELRR